MFGFVVLRTEPRTSLVSGKHNTTEVYLQPLFVCLGVLLVWEEFKMYFRWLFFHKNLFYLNFCFRFIYFYFMSVLHLCMYVCFASMYVCV